MKQKKQSAVAFEGNTADLTYIQIIAFCSHLVVKLATDQRGLA